MYQFGYLQAVANAKDLSCMEEYLEELGEKHHRFGAQVPHFDVRDFVLILYLKGL